MSDASTKKLLSMYTEDAEAPAFLSGFFRSPPENFHDTEMVEIDIERDEEDVAIVVTDYSTGGNWNESNKYTSKGFVPPVYREIASLDAFKLMKRRAGRDPFADPDFGATAISESFRVFRKLEKKIRRAIELMASQVLSTGTLTLVDENGATLYTLDFQPKASHFDEVGTDWGEDGSSGDPLADLEEFAETIRQDGKHEPTRLIFGRGAFRRFKANTKVQAALDNRRMNLGEIAPAVRGRGATFQGYIWLGNYRLEMWTYNAVYKHPQTGNLTPYVGLNDVIMMSEGGRLDLSYGNIPKLVPPDQRVLPYLPGRLSASDQGLDLITNAWVTPDGSNLMVSAEARPLTIPTGIDTFGRLTVVGS